MIENTHIADMLDEVAALLEAQDADPFRVRAWKLGARTLRELKRPAADIVDESGRSGLEKLEHIGPVLARSVQQIVQRGKLALLDRLRGDVGPEALLTTLPGIGEVLAHRIYSELGVESLEQLEIVANDGRLEKLPGVGPRRAAAVREILASRLAHHRAARKIAVPSVELLLEIDQLYRLRAAEGTLRRICPKRMNPERKAWLPIMHASRDGWHFTALFSNTALAHTLGRTNDWVVLYCERDGIESQFTVVDAPSGRVVRGREAEQSSKNAA